MRGKYDYGKIPLIRTFREQFFEEFRGIDGENSKWGYLKVKVSEHWRFSVELWFCLFHKMIEHPLHPSGCDNVGIPPLILNKKIAR